MPAQRDPRTGRFVGWAAPPPPPPPRRRVPTGRIVAVFLVLALAVAALVVFT